MIKILLLNLRANKADLFDHFTKAKGSPKGGSKARWLAFLHLDLAALDLIPSVSAKNLDNFFAVAKVIQRRCLEESGQWLEHVY